MDTIFLSSDGIFKTIEGEGPSIGMPTIFLRLSMCNLTCVGWGTPENPTGCDTADVWKVKNKLTFEELFAKLAPFSSQLASGWLFKITGGEPTLQQKAFLEFLHFLGSEKEIYLSDIDFEMETNATILPDPGWRNYQMTYICSPKLSNNGDPEEKRYKPEVLRWHARSQQSYFKFVVRSEEDVQEILTRYVGPFNIPKSDIWLMPECATREQLIKNSPPVAELCKKHGFNFSSRLQVLLWDKTTGV